MCAIGNTLFGEYIGWCIPSAIIAKETLTMRISEALAVQKGGLQTWMPLVMKTCDPFFNLYPQLNS